MLAVPQNAGVHHIAVGGVERKQGVSRWVIDRNHRLIAALFRRQRQIVRRIERRGKDPRIAELPAIAKQPLFPQKKGGLPADVVNKHRLSADGNGGVRHANALGIYPRAIVCQNGNIGRGGDDQPFAQHGVNVRAVIVKAVKLRLALFVLRDLVVGKKSAHAVKAAQVLIGCHQNDGKHQNKHRKQLRCASHTAMAAGRGLFALKILARQIVRLLFPH